MRHLSPEPCAFPSALFRFMFEVVRPLSPEPRAFSCLPSRCVWGWGALAMCRSACRTAGPCSAAAQLGNALAFTCGNCTNSLAVCVCSNHLQVCLAPTPSRTCAARAASSSAPAAAGRARATRLVLLGAAVMHTHRCVLPSYTRRWSFLSCPAPCPAAACTGGVPAKTAGGAA